MSNVRSPLPIPSSTLIPLARSDEPLLLLSGRVDQDSADHYLTANEVGALDTKLLTQAERDRVPFLKKAVQFVPVIACPAGATTYLAPAPFEYPQEVPLDSIVAPHLRDLADRAAQANVSGAAVTPGHLSYEDLIAARPHMLSGELRALPELRREHFSWRSPGREAFQDLPVYQNANTGVSVTLSRKRETRPLLERATDGQPHAFEQSLKNSGLTIEAPPGSRLLLMAPGWDSRPRQHLMEHQQTQGEFHLNFKDMADFGDYLSGRVELLVVMPPQESQAGLPEVIDKIALALPATKKTTIYQTPPSRPL